MPGDAIPRYLLYGEAPVSSAGSAVADRFIHIETIACRSTPAGWTIRPHAHAALEHLLFVHEGSGEMRVEGQRLPFGPGVMTVPAGAVHGFAFAAGTDGHVVTVAEPIMRALAGEHPAIARLRGAAYVLPLAGVAGGATGGAALRPLLDALASEMAGAAPLTGLAGEALFQLLLVAACRLLPEDEAEGTAPRRRAAVLVARYRAQIDRHLADGWSVADHARALGASPARLRACCIEVAGAAPIRLLHERMLAEARRQLAYTDRTVAEIGYALGFDDPAYFSRFFRRGMATTPACWRADQAGANDSVSISAIVPAE